MYYDVNYALLDYICVLNLSADLSINNNVYSVTDPTTFELKYRIEFYLKICPNYCKKICGTEYLTEYFTILPHIFPLFKIQKDIVKAQIILVTVSVSG